MIRLALLILSILTIQVVHAQALPSSSRTVYKCNQDGKVVYSDSPCPGAERIDVQPTRGLNKSSGRELVGSDVRREVHREQFAEALRPLTGMNAQQLNTAGKRYQLPTQAQRDCHVLDNKIPQLEQAEKSASGSELRGIQDQLFKARGQYRGLRC